MTPVLKYSTQPGTPYNLANSIEDQQFDLYESDLVRNYEDDDDSDALISIENLIADYGTITKKSNGIWTFNPDKNFSGEVNLFFKVISSAGGFTNGENSFTITPENDSPQLTGNRFGFSEGLHATAYTFKESQLLQGFTDVDGDTLKVEGLRTSKAIETASDSKETRISKSNDIWTLTPEDNFSGPINLYYAITDGKGGQIETSTTVNFAKVSDAPRLTGQLAELAEGREDTDYTIRTTDLLKGFSDANGDPLTLVDLSSNVGSLNGNDNGTWTLTPDQNYSGKVILSYSITDSKGNYAQAKNSFVINEVWDSPQLFSEQTALPKGRQDEPYLLNTFDLIKGFTDPDGDALAATNLSTSSKNGILVDNKNGTWTFTPKKGFSGDVKLSYFVTDSQRKGAVQARQSFFIQTNNSAPKLTGQKTNFSSPLANALARQPERSSFLLRKSDLLQGYTDADNDKLSIEDIQVSKGSLEKNNDDSWIFMASGQSGLVQLSYDIHDGQGGSIYASNTFFIEQTRSTIKNGSKKRDNLLGTTDNDELTGLKGNDKLYGRAGDDVLDGGHGKDRIKGGVGDDDIIGGKGKDQLWGQAGEDTFIVRAGAGHDIIKDFVQGEDLVQLASGLSSIEIKNRHGDAWLYQDNDLIAKVIGSANSLRISGDMVM